MNAPMQTAQQHRFPEVGTLEIRDNTKPKIEDLPEVFSAQLGRQICRTEELLFELLCVQNLLEQGCPELALQRCRETTRTK